MLRAFGKLFSSGFLPLSLASPVCCVPPQPPPEKLSHLGDFQGWVLQSVCTHTCVYVGLE